LRLHPFLESSPESVQKRDHDVAENCNLKEALLIQRINRQTLMPFNTGFLIRGLLRPPVPCGQSVGQRAANLDSTNPTHYKEIDHVA